MRPVVTRNRRPYLTSGIAAILVVTVGFITYRLLTPKGIERDAGDMMESIERGDGARLHSFLLDYEIKALALDPRKVDRVLDEIVVPRLNRLRREGAPDLAEYGRGSQGVASQAYYDPSGKRFDFWIVAQRTDSGSRTLLSSLIYNAWMVDFIILEGREYSKESMAQAIVRGIDRDLRTLEDIGIKGRVDVPPHDQFVTWEELRKSKQVVVTGSSH